MELLPKKICLRYFKIYPNMSTDLEVTCEIHFPDWADPTGRLSKFHLIQPSVANVVSILYVLYMNIIFL